MILEQHWFVVCNRNEEGADVPIAAFLDEDTAKCFGADVRDTVIQRPIFIGDVETKCMRLLREIVRPDFSPEGDRRTQKAIDDAKKLFGYQ